ncbi:MAG: MobF family relaxase, partial [Proteocatella sp.]
MLSISNVTAKMASSYYEKDGYYARDMDDGDKWQGRLCKQLALPVQSLDPNQFNQLVLENSQRAGFDLTFSAPKSVSVAMVINEEMKKDMLACHNEAVEKILQDIEANEIATRVTKNGVTETVQTGNMACGKFNHYVSRNSDMQLHTHAVILNKTMYDGKMYAISNESIYKNKILYGQLYRNELAKNLQKKGYILELTDHEKGFFEIAGVDPEVLERFSTRRQEILQQLKSWSADDAVNASKAALMTRKAKEHRDLGELTKSWRESVLEAGEIQIEKENESVKIRKEDKLNAFDQAVIRLSEHEYAFSKRDLERAVLAEGCISGMNRADFEKQLDRSYLIYLGKPITEGEDVYYTSPENQATELKIMQNVVESKGVMHSLSEETVKNDLQIVSKEHGLTLSKEQNEAVLHISTSKDRFSAVQGLAGTGKTYMLNATREVLERNGYTVIGASYTGKAAEG